MISIPLLQTEQLHLKIGQRVLLDALNWQVHAGECWSVIGRNGAGKSSLLRSLAGMRGFEGGAVLIQDKPLHAWNLLALARVRSFLAQSRVDAFAYRAIETVLCARHPFQDGQYWDSQQEKMLAMAALRQLDVEEFAQRDVRSLSGGERQRVAIAALIAQDAPLMMLDEPANALDLAHQVSVMQLLEKICREQAKAVIMVSHDLNLAHRVATHTLLMMPDGSALIGSKDEVMTEERLSLCLGHPIERVQHGTSTLFLPRL